MTKRLHWFIQLGITERSQPSADGQGYMNTPGIYTKAHIDAWRKITDKVHQEGGYIFIQIMHAGRVSHPDNTPHHRQPVANGIEIHGANGYLIQQFLSENSNHRNDEYGGTIENRARFAIEVTKAIVDEIGADKMAFRISPGSTLSGIDEGESGPALYRYLVQELNKLNLAYLHIMHR